MNKIKIFGLTGGIGCGKSTVSKHWASQGLPIIDADLISRGVVNPLSEIGRETLNDIVITFGDVLNDDGSLDRRKLGGIVFGNPKLMHTLESIMYPRMKIIMREQVHQLVEQGYSLACYDNAVLLEKTHYERYRPIVVVHVDTETQVQRIMMRNPDLSKGDIIKRVFSQMPSDQRLKLASYVIDNSGTPEETQRIADVVLTQIRSSK